MKKNISLLSLSLLLSGILLISCTKDSPAIGNQDAGTVTINTTGNTNNNSARVNPAKLGIISGVLNPVPLKASITAYNDHFVSEETTMNQDGTFKLNNLPADGYILQIRYVPVTGLDYLTFEVYKIIVVAGQNTDVGVITLPE
jgi:hypothetical protein